MRWQDGRESGVEDRRGGGGIGAPHIIGGGGLGAVTLVLLLSFVFHVDPRQLLSANGDDPVAESAAPASTAASSCPEGDETCRFADVIHTSTDDVWSALFAAEGKPYHPSTLVLYAQGTPTGCGYGQSAMGPFYCPEDERIYLDLDFFATLERKLSARGDFARAYVIAHEEGHHIQKLLGVSDAVHNQQQGLSRTAANRLSVRLELQADCYAGVWAKRADDQRHWLEAGDIDEALGAAAAVGDDTLQKESQGQVIPDSFTHGTSAQREHWFRAGFAKGDPADCDTFTGAI
jgi:predicted metalloprotease